MAAMESGHTVLIVDDQEPNRRLLEEHMHNLGHTPLLAENGLSALARLESCAPDVVLLDLMMPDMDGYQVLEHMQSKDSLSNIPVIVISGIDDMKDIARCIKRGAVDYLVKPFNSVLLQARLDACLDKKRMRDREIELRRQIQDYNLRLEERVHEQVRQIGSTQMATIFALSKLAESRDPDTGEHLDKMREYCRLLGEAMREDPRFSDRIGDEFLEYLYEASPLHDVGKVGIRDEVLLKPGPLTPEEFEQIKKHTTLGADTLRTVNASFPGNMFIGMGIEMAQSHHEKWNGAGYPEGLSGEDIPLAARILALCDVYDAITSKRCYKDAISHDDAVKIILSESGKHFDPAVVEAFRRVEGEFRRLHGQFGEPSM